MRIRINADIRSNRHRFFSDLARRQRAVLGQRPRCRHCKRTARSDRDDSIVGLDEITGARQKKGGFPIGHDHHRLEPAQQPIRAPVARELDSRSFEIAAVLFELGFESGKQSEGVRGGTGESGKDALVVEPPDLAGAVFDDGVAERYLAVTGQDGVAIVTHRENGGGVNHRPF
jgi:hypothetical protein